MLKVIVKKLPFYKRYFGGGSGSVRGFGNKTLGPLYPNGKLKVVKFQFLEVLT
jgi:outer membrane protein assembly factor BamA